MWLSALSWYSLKIAIFLVTKLWMCVETLFSTENKLVVRKLLPGLFIYGFLCT